MGNTANSIITKPNLAKLGLLTFCLLTLTGCTSSNRWTLVMCRTMLNSSECYDNAFTIDDTYESKQECIKAGREINRLENYPGFECGKNCRRDGGLLICEEL